MSEQITGFSIRRYEPNSDRDGYYAVSGKNALGKTTTLQVPFAVFEEGGGVRAAAEAELKTILGQAQGAYNELHDTLADLNRQAREATQTFEKTIRGLFGVRIGGEVVEATTNLGNNIRIVTPTPSETPDIETEESLPA